MSFSIPRTSKMSNLFSFLFKNKNFKLCFHRGEDLEWNELCGKCKEESIVFYRNLGFTEGDDLDVDMGSGRDVDGGDAVELEDGEISEELIVHDEDTDSHVFDLSEDPATRRLVYLTPEMIEMFRQSEIYRMDARQQRFDEMEAEEDLHDGARDVAIHSLVQKEDGVADAIETSRDTQVEHINQKEQDLQRIVDEAFDKGARERKPVLWPVLSMRF